MNSSNMNNKISIIDSEVGNVNINCHSESNGFDFPHIGIIGLISDIICYIIGSKKEKREREYFKRRNYDSKTGTYLDQYCARRLMSDDSYVQFTENAYGEKIIRYQNGIVRNVTQEEYNNKSGTVTQLTGYSMHDKSQFFKSPIGYRYKDRKNGEIYVIRELKLEQGHFLFYMNIKDGMIVRPTDGQYKIEEEAKKRNKKYYTKTDFDKMVAYLNSHINNFNLSTFYRNEFETVDCEGEHIIRAASFRKEI